MESSTGSWLREREGREETIIYSVVTVTGGEEDSMSSSLLVNVGASSGPTPMHILHPQSIVVEFASCVGAGSLTILTLHSHIFRLA